MQNIQWFPGHMAKTRRQIAESLRLVDAVAELADARIPRASRNPELPALVGAKPRLLLLNKSDAADPAANRTWLNTFAREGLRVLPVDCRSGAGLSAFLPAVNELLRERREALRRKGMAGRPLRVMVVGIPNVGKSSFINRMARSVRAKVENRPGVTRGNQWFTLPGGVELLDTPGVLWPKFDDPAVGERLAFTGAIRDQILDTETLAVRLLEELLPDYAELLRARYGVDAAAWAEPSAGGSGAAELLCEIGRRRGMLLRGGEVDTERAAAALLDEFRSARLGRITLERPEIGT